jgi:hypothetical protein
MATNSITHFNGAPGKARVVIDIYSRYVTGWMLAHAEQAKLAEALLADAIANQGVEAGQLTVHADRGTSMASKPVAFLLADLGVTKTTSARIVPTITPTRSRTSEPSSTARSSRGALAVSKTPTAFAGGSSGGTTTTTVIQGLVTTPPLMSTTGELS